MRFDDDAADGSDKLQVGEIMMEASTAHDAAGAGDRGGDVDDGNAYDASGNDARGVDGDCNADDDGTGRMQIMMITVTMGCCDGGGKSVWATCFFVRFASFCFCLEAVFIEIDVSMVVLSISAFFCLSMFIERHWLHFVIDDLSNCVC